ncbi:hypothetical protein LTR56_027741, partial [Elasticomyces elasticus]
AYYKDGDETLTTTAAESSMREPKTIIPAGLRLLRSSRLLSALWACLTQATLQTAFDATLPLFVKETFHWTPVGAGLVFLPLMCPCLLGPLIGHMTDKHGPKWYSTAGFVLACPALVLLRQVRHDNTGQKLLLCVLLTVAGLALTLILVPMMAEITSAVLAKEALYPPGYFGKSGATAQSCSFFNIVWAIGCMTGSLLGGLAMNRVGWENTVLILAGASVVSAVPTALWTESFSSKACDANQHVEGPTNEQMQVD